VVLEQEPWFISLAETGQEHPSNLLVQFFAQVHRQVQQAMILGQTRCQLMRKQTREQVFLGEQLCPADELRGRRCLASNTIGSDKLIRITQSNSRDSLSTSVAY
jgi:hypothetical protein